MVPGIISREEFAMFNHIIEKGLKVNMAFYLDITEKAVVAWCKQIAGEKLWVWQQDLTPVHMSRETQNLAEGQM